MKLDLEFKLKNTEILNEKNTEILNENRELKLNWKITK
jgi:hypothetical protein